MSRFAQARARAGFTVPVEDEGRVWESEGQRAADLVAGKPVTRPPFPTQREPAPREPATKEPATVVRHAAVVPDARGAVVAAEARPAAVVPEMRLHAVPESVRRDLGPLVERVFLSSPETAVRSVLFCTAAGEATGEVALRTAELLAADTRRRVALVEDGSSAPRTPADARGNLVTRIGWYPPESARASNASGTGAKAAGDEQGAKGDLFGEHVSDLFGSFDFVIVSASAPNPEDLVPIAREVGGVVLLVTREKTKRKSARALAATLREAQATLLGVVLIR